MSKHGIVIDFDAKQFGNHRTNRSYPDRQFAFNVKDRKGELLLYDVIGQDFMGNGLTAQRVEDALREMGEVDELLVLINSPGGFVHEALGIYNALVRSPANVITHNVGAAWSAAGWILQAGDERLQSENASLMIHNSQGVAIGDKRAMSKESEILNKMDDTIAATFARRSGRKADTFRKIMDDESWFTGQEALDAKLVDRVVSAKSGAKNLDPAAFGLKRRENVSVESAVAAGIARVNADKVRDRLKSVGVA
jgi:ATP-dependent Clp protease, protease subunit